MWQGNSHDLIGYISTAGNVSRIESIRPDDRFFWSKMRGKAATKRRKNTERNRVAPFGDRRQELVFIVQDLKHRNFQEILDEYLVIDKMMTLGVDRWKATIGDIMLES